jgi:hypothetical protein
VRRTSFGQFVRQGGLLLLGAALLGALTPLRASTVTEIRPLLMQAIQQGSARAVLEGPGADYIRKTFGAHKPIEVEVQRLHPLPQPGCHRLEVTTRQQDVMVKGARSDQSLVWQISLCQDGRLVGDPELKGTTAPDTKSVSRPAVIQREGRP